MKSKEDLRKLLQQINHKSYKAYKETKGTYQMPGFILSIDAVQGDPFATPSRIRLFIDNRNNLESCFFDTRYKKIAAEDHLLRDLNVYLKKRQRGKSGSGKSGQIFACKVHQMVQERTAVLLSEQTIEVRLEVGFPAYGRTIAAVELEKIFYQVFPEMIQEVFIYTDRKKEKLKKAVDLTEDQYVIRQELKKRNLVAFVANGSILPRESGVSDLPLKGAIPFESPESLLVTLTLPHVGKLSGMGIKEGVTVIAGGGYHGKSTLLKAIQNGVYNHIASDGREYVITRESAVKLRAEEGRCIRDENISMFINHLPNKMDTRHFNTENASGSTSQAAQTIEALECGAEVLLIDEDTSATNFMVRDEKMATLVAAEKEPITPYLACVRSIYETFDVSTILVVGSSGAYLSAADCVLCLEEYVVHDVTKRAKEIADPYTGIKVKKEKCICHRIKKRQINKLRCFGMESIVLDREDIIVRNMEQLVDDGQAAGIAYMMQYALENFADGNKTVIDLIEEVYEHIEKHGFASVVPLYYGAGMPVMPRNMEFAAAFFRYRSI